MKQKITLLLFMISFLSWEGNAQTQFWSDTFEDVGAPSSGTRTPENDGGGVFSTPYPSYFARVTNSDIDLFFGSYSGQEGSKFWAAEDNDGAFGSGNEEQQIDFTNINISGKTGLSFKGLFAANNQNAAFESLAFGFTHSDYIIVEYQIDGGPYVPLIRFFANNSVGTGVNNKSLAEELSGDEIGEGTILTTSFGEFTKTIPATGTILNLRIRVFTNGGSEEIAFDNFRLFEAPVCTNPTVPTLAASANPVCNSASTTLNITGTLNDATQWAIYTGSCGGSLVGTTATSTFVVTPTGPSTTYYVRGEGGCVTPGSCGSITINVSTVSLTPSSQTNVACNGGANGAASVNVATGGVGPYTYNWTPGNPTGDGTTSVTGLTAGTWTCTVTDANGCTASQNFTITQPTALSLTPASQTNVACNGGANGAAAVNTATGGAGGYTYNWTPGNPIGDGTTSVTGLTAGTWTCTVTDANGCTISQNFTITQPTALSLTPASQTNVACNGGANGAAAVNAATGGAGGYTYNWTPGNPTGDGTPSVTGLTAGTWTCTVTDANGCTTSQNFTITQPTALSLTPASQTNVACNGGANGAAAVNAATGGAGGYTYNWTPGNPIGDGTTSVTGLAAGTWTCTVTDANGCTTSQNFTITQPTAIDNTISENTTGILTANATDAGMTYQWYECPNTLLNGETNQDFIPSSLGDYKVVITFNGCTVESACYTVTALDTKAFENETQFTIYPNPTNGLVIIKTNTSGEFVIVNQLGQTMKTFNLNLNIENIINVENLADGIYFIKGLSSNQIKAQRLIIKK